VSITVEIGEFIEASLERPVIDVRSPAEYNQGHMPGAHNIPVFNNRERKIVGTLYKQSGRDAALKKGLEIVGPKMRGFVEQAEEIVDSGGALVHCWRGGMRSSSFAWLLETAGIETVVLRDGYKAFRNFVLDLFEEEYPLVVLGGFTGSGKTEILEALMESGEQVIDLEDLANHKGSAFGHLGEQAQPSGEQFENELAMQLYRMDSSRPIWVEDESRQIGARILPGGFYETMRSAPVVRVDLPRSLRVRKLAGEYGVFESSKLRQSLFKIKKRLGGQRTKQALQALREGKMERVAEIALSYYDKAYRYGLNKRDENTIKTVRLDRLDAVRNARIILDECGEWLDSKMAALIEDEF